MEPMSDYLDLAAREREQAKLALRRARQARKESAHAAFYDKAVEFARQAAETQGAAQRHLDTARRYERLAEQAASRSNNGARNR